MEDKTILYSVRYPSAQEEGERIKVRGDRQAAEAKLTEFLRRMREERTYEPIPGREEKGRRFAALARQYAAEALREEDGEVTEVTVEDGLDGRLQVRVALEWKGEGLTAEVTL